MIANIQKEPTTIIQPISLNKRLAYIFFFDSNVKDDQKPDSNSGIYLIIPDNDIVYINNLSHMQMTTNGWRFCFSCIRSCLLMGRGGKI